MARIVFALDIEAEPDRIAEALGSAQGIAGWWTTDVSLAGGEGEVMTLGFPVAPRPFELRVDEVSEQRVRWSSVGEFPRTGSVPRSCGRFARARTGAARRCTSRTTVGPQTRVRSRMPR